MNTAALLKQAGLTYREGQVYIALLELGGAGVTTIGKHIGLQRTQVYPILSSLTRKGLARLYFQDNKRFYKPARPKKIIDVAQKKLETLASIVPNLENIEKNPAPQIGLRFIETQNELQNFCTEIVKTHKRKTIYSIGGFQHWEELVGQKFAEQFRKDRVKEKIKTRAIVTQEDTDASILHRSTLSDIRWLPKKQEFKSVFHIFPDKILISTPQHTSLAVAIEVPAMVDIFKSVFDILWDFLD